MASVGYGIADLFGVVGVVLFVQIIPKLLKVNLAAERERLAAAAIPAAGKTLEQKKYRNLDEFDLPAFAAAAILGALIAGTKTEAVAVSYAATYPLALIMVALFCEFIPLLF